VYGWILIMLLLQEEKMQMQQGFTVIGHSENAGAEFNTSEKNAHND
jgi:hypothetical protein